MVDVVQVELPEGYLWVFLNQSECTESTEFPFIVRSLDINTDYFLIDLK